MIWIQQEDALNGLHGDPRFKALVKKIGLPEDY